MPRVTQGSGIGSQAVPTCGIWIRWSIRAMPANPASSAASATPFSHAAGSSPQGNRDTWSTTSSPWGSGRGAGASGAATGADPAVTVVTWSQPSSCRFAQDRREAAQLVGEHLGRHRSVTSGVPGPAELGGRVERDRHGGETVLPCVVDPPGTPYGIQTQGVHDRGEATAHAARDDQLQQRERVLRGVQVVAAAADHAAQVVRRDDLRGAVPLLRPGRLAGAGRAHEDDESGVRQPGLDAHGRSLAGTSQRVSPAGCMGRMDLPRDDGVV